ncbi:MAG: hypothetical protein U0X40_04410 [Ferruginibacter sp.]
MIIWLRILLTFFLLPAGILAQAQPPVHAYTVKDGRMYIALSRQLPAPALDSFVKQYELEDLQLDDFIRTAKADSLLKRGWKVDIINRELAVISKPLGGFSKSGNPADQLVFVEAARPLPQMNNQSHFGYNRFVRKSPFAVSDSVVCFFLRGHPDARHVTLAGTFNNWDPAVLQMTKTDSGWIANVALKTGKHLYKFIIDGNWTIDKDNRNSEDDGVGNNNSVYYKTNVNFRLQGYSGARKVFVAGSFNNWNEKELLLMRSADDWVLPVYLSEGTYTYRFIADGRWLADPANPDKLPNEYNEFNSVIRIGSPYIFRLPGYGDARKVMLYGSFNNWKEDELLMQKTDSGWVFPYTLGDGNYEYRYRVDGKIIGEAGPRGNSVLVINPNYTFKLPGFADARQVYLAGDLNNWDSTTFRMTKTDSGWIFPAHLNRGKYRYKFIVDGRWILDPANPFWEENEYGTGNSVLWKEEE